MALAGPPLEENAVAVAFRRLCRYGDALGSAVRAGHKRQTPSVAAPKRTKDTEPTATTRRTNGDCDQYDEQPWVTTEELIDRMATDYDAPRRGDVDELNEDSIEELKARRAEAQSGSIDVDETELAESLELPGADLSSLSGEELTVRVLPKQSDEFTCSSCFLVHHRSRLAREKNGQLICRDCA
jgi:hypothetical protein